MLVDGASACKSAPATLCAEDPHSSPRGTKEAPSEAATAAQTCEKSREPAADSCRYGSASIGQDFFCLIFMAVFVVVFAMNATILIFTSMLTDVGVWFYEWLAEPHPELAGDALRLYSFSAGLGLMAAVYFLDLWRWKGDCRVVFVGVCFFAMVTFCVGVLFVTPRQPAVPLVSGVMAEIVATYLLKECCFKRVRAEVFNRVAALTFFLVAVVDAVLWATWISLPEGVAGHAAWSVEVDSELQGEDPLLDQSAAFVLWCSPAAIAVSHGVIALFVLLRARFQQFKAKSGRKDATPGLEVMGALTVMAALGFGAYIAASLGGNDNSISRVVLAFTGAVLVLVFLYLARWVGLRRLLTLAAESSAVRAAAALLTSDWVKGLLVLIGPPLLPLVVAVEAVHNVCRQSLRCCCRGIVEPETPEERQERFHWLTLEGSQWLSQAWRYLFEDATSVLMKAMCCGAILSVSTIAVSTYVPLFLAVVNEQMEQESLEVCLAVVFGVVLGLFLIPPITGQVIYGFAATVIVPKYGYGEQFWTGILVSSAVSLVGKMVASAFEMKVIGVPGSKSLAVKRFIGVHTQFMKALRFVLSRPGCSAGKVSVLTFGPDWPTSVLTGILDLPLLPMMLGTLPVVIVILPCCISFGFLLKAEAGAEPQHAGQNRSIAAVNLLLSGVIGAAGNGLIAFFVQRVLSENHEELSKPNSDWMRDPLEAEVLASVEKATEEARRWNAKTKWGVVPGLLRFCLACGSMVATASFYVLVQPRYKAFESYRFGVALPDNVTLLTPINPAGHLVLGGTALVVAVIAIFQSWGRLLAPERPETSSASE